MWSSSQKQKLPEISAHIQNLGNGINNTYLLYYIVLKAKKKIIWFKIPHRNLCTPKKNLDIYLASCDVKSEHTASPESPIHRHRCVFVVNWDEWDGTPLRSERVLKEGSCILSSSSNGYCGGYSGTRGMCVSLLHRDSVQKGRSLGCSSQRVAACEGWGGVVSTQS